MKDLLIPFRTENYIFFLEAALLVVLPLLIATSFLCVSMWRKIHSVPTLLDIGGLIYFPDAREQSNIEFWNKRNEEVNSKSKSEVSNSFIQAYADCMVDTYVHGYLRKIIPDHGDPLLGGLKERIRLYKVKHGLSDDEFPFNKMFILIPSSGYIPPTLDKLEPGRILGRQTLDPLVLNRAGVDGREYKSAVYKILYPGDNPNHITVAMEGAPPLLCLSDSCKENAELNKFKKDLIYLFYKKLKEKIKQYEEFEDSCEVIYIDDGKKISLADNLILRSIDEKNFPQ